jgi:hypothetical protein
MISRQQTRTRTCIGIVRLYDLNSSYNFSPLTSVDHLSWSKVPLVIQHLSPTDKTLPDLKLTKLTSLD